MAVKAYTLEASSYDVLVIGAGGAGLRAALAAVEAGASVAVLSKVPVLHSHTAAAQGGINAALGNRTADDWRWHMYDTVRGSDWLGDQDAIATMCEHAPQAIIELEHMGVPFTRDANGKIYQRAYGGQSTEYGKGALAYRACAAADRTGHAMLYTLQGQALKAGVKVFEECVVLDLLMSDAAECLGAIAWRLETGELFTIQAKTTIIATGGGGQVFASTTTASSCTGDGNAFVLRAGLALQDMEFVQFHPTALYGSGLLVSEAARAEGGYLINADGERFMERYAPKYKDLASRDVISRAIVQEIREGRGCGPHRDHVQLCLQHLPETTIREKIPGVAAVSKAFAHLDVTQNPIPVLPAAHYMMGGIPTNAQSEVVRWKDGGEEIVPGLLAVGEAACTSVHGANRLGCNSLLDLVVFGKAAGQLAAAQAKDTAYLPAIPEAAIEKALSRFDAMRHAKGGVRVSSLRNTMKEIMHEHAAIYRNDDMLKAGIGRLDELWKIARKSLSVEDRSLLWNTELAGALEQDNLLYQAKALLHSAHGRTESRGAHSRQDYLERDDANWLAHSLVSVDGNGAVAQHKRPVRLQAEDEDIPHFPLEIRGY
ncbi:MAG: succinate dehydrogenase flavoprotein subunit [Rickettsiales bacterium]